MAYRWLITMDRCLHCLASLIVTCCSPRKPPQIIIFIGAGSQPLCSISQPLRLSKERYLRRLAITAGPLKRRGIVLGITPVDLHTILCTPPLSAGHVHATDSQHTSIRYRLFETSCARYIGICLLAIIMGHANPPVPASGFQALILCGPGESLNTISSNPEENPKALIPIALKPMITWVIEWCKRAGINGKW